MIKYIKISKSGTEKPIRIVIFDLLNGNFDKEDFTLDNIKISAGSKITAPDFGQDNSLRRGNLLFHGWYVDKDCTREWDFENDIVNNLRSSQYRPSNKEH